MDYPGFPIKHYQKVRRIKFDNKILCCVDEHCASLIFTWMKSQVVRREVVKINVHEAKL